MKEYYIAQDEQKKGPYSLKDLKYETVLPDTLLWKEGWPNWMLAKDAAQEVSAIELIINDALPPLPQREEKPKKKKPNLLMSVAQIADGDLEPLGSLLDSDEEQESKEQVASKEKPSWIDTFYHFCGSQIDALLLKNESKVDSSFFFRNLNKARNYYKSLSLVRQKSMSFLISIFLVASFLTLWLLLVADGEDLLAIPLAMIPIVLVISGYVALYQIKFVDKPISKVVNAIVFFTLGFLPKVIKNAIVQIVKFLIFSILIIFFGWFIGGIYLAFRVVIAFVNPKNMPSFERFG